MPRTALAILIALAAVVGVTGCAGSDSPPPTVVTDPDSPTTATTRDGVDRPTGTTTPGAAEDEDLEALLLTLDDMPPGWELEEGTDLSGTDGPACFQVIDDELGEHPSAETAFTDPADVPAFFQKVIDMGPEALDEFEDVAAGLDGCTDVSFESRGEVIPGVIEPLEFQAFGDDGVAYEMAFTDGTATLVFDLVVVRVGELAILFGYGDAGRTDLPQFEGLVEAAVDKVEASGVGAGAPAQP